MNRDDVKTILAVSVVAALLVGLPVVLFMQPYFEAKAFNKFTTGPKATYWDALWVQLRVTP